MTEKRTPAAERQQETATGLASLLRLAAADNWPDTGPEVPGRESVLTRSGEPVRSKMTQAPESTDKLDATTNVVVNGPENAPLDWDQINWRQVEENVRRLRQRIFTASQAGDLSRVRSLQKLMLRSRSNALLSVRRVTERNAGRLTPGVDGEVALTAQAKMQLVARMLHPIEPFTAMPVRRVYIPKPGSKKQRPLGIPVLSDRAHQARVVSALEPEWEARFESRSYGFRPGRGCHDAISAIYMAAKGKNPRRMWVLDADLAAAFDRISHDHILAMLGTFPARGMIRQWLKAGVVENGRFAPTEAGTPQGGVASPVLLNVALHGMEDAAGVRFRQADRSDGRVRMDSPIVIRYADDLVCLCHTRQDALQVKAKLAGWLAPRGLAFNEDKTRVVTLNEGFDFLGFNVRRYRGKLMIKPSKAAIRRIRERLRTEMLALRGANAQAVIKRLNPIIRGWAAYYRTVVSSRTFSVLDDYLWRLTYKWATFSHSNKPTSWVVDQYFGQFNKSRRDRWVFGDRKSGACLVRFTWTRIARHQIVKDWASPDDPDLADYWAERRRKAPPLPIGKASQSLFETQDGRCAICGGSLLPAEDPPASPREWEDWLSSSRVVITKRTVTREPGTTDEGASRLIHARCERAKPARSRPGASARPEP
jgi:RNA-directed DNA polymerase